MIAPIACVVEGYGELPAVPILIRRIAARVSPSMSVEVPRPIRTSRDKLVRSEVELQRVVAFAAQQIQRNGAILVVVDADDDAPCQIGPQLLHRAREAAVGLPISVVLAKREFEGWFIAAAESLRGKRGLPDHIVPPDNPEAIRDAKGWLEAHLPRGRAYSPTTDQPALAAMFDLDLARERAPSFDKFYRDVRRLLEGFVV